VSNKLFLPAAVLATSICIVVADQLLVTHFAPLLTTGPLLVPVARTIWLQLFLVLILVVLWRLYPLGRLALGVMGFGLVSNTLTLTRFGRLVDYLPTSAVTQANLADVLVVAGSLWLAMRVLDSPKPPKNTP
jgi:lipoprotein signal peptidase